MRIELVKRFQQLLLMVFPTNVANYFLQLFGRHPSGEYGYRTYINQYVKLRVLSVAMGRQMIAGKNADDYAIKQIKNRHRKLRNRKQANIQKGA